MRRPPVALRAASVRYGGVAALADVDLDVEAGEVVALVGANGSGKTTLLRLVAGLARPHAGRALVAGHAAGSRAARRLVAFVPDEPAGLDELTVAEHVALLAALFGVDQGPGRQALADLELEPWRDVRVGGLSRGLRRRAALAAALAADPGVLLVDEATVTLDAAAVARLVAVLRARATAGRASLVATHDLSFAERACDRAILLREGRVTGTCPGAATGALVALASARKARTEGGGQDVVPDVVAAGAHRGA